MPRITTKPSMTSTAVTEMNAGSASVRVLHLIEDLGAGGAERLLFVNLSHLDRHTVDGAVCHLYDRALHWRQSILELGYPVMSLNMTSIRDLPRGVGRLLRLLKQHSFDVIHTHLYGANLVGRVAGALCGVPVISSLHNPDYEPTVFMDNVTVSPAKLRVLRWMDRASCRLARPVFVAVSEYVKQSAGRHLGIASDRTTVIYNAIDLTTFACSGETAARAARVRAELQLANGDPVILCIARMDPQKGLRYLVEALPALIGEFPRVVALFVGGGSPAARQSLGAVAEALHVQSHVHFLGVKTDVRPYLEMCDVFVLPSLYEGMGIALVEAMAMERACVSTRTTAVPEVVASDTSGLLVTPANSQELAAAVARLLRDSALRSRMGAAGRRIVAERFNVSHNIRQLESLYHQVVNSRAAA